MRGGLHMPMFQQGRQNDAAVALAAAHGDAQLLHEQAARLLLMASEAGARADARIAGVE